MPILPAFKMMPFAEIPVGSLVAIEDGGSRSIGICLVQLPEDTGIGVIEDAEIEQPYIRWVSGDFKRGLVLATDEWAIEPKHGEMAFPYQDHNFPRAAGLLRICEDGWQMNFATSHPDTLGRFNMEWWNLAPTKKADRLTSDLALFTEWDVWLSKPHRDANPAAPFLRFTAVQAKPAG